MKIRTIKKAIKALRDGRRTSLLAKVRLSNIVYLEKYLDKRHKQDDTEL